MADLVLVGDNHDYEQKATHLDSTALVHTSSIRVGTTNELKSEITQRGSLVEMQPVQLTVREVMEIEPVSVRPDCRVQEVIRLMNVHRVGAVLVTTDEARLLGIFSERDLLRRVYNAVPGWREYPVVDWMTRDPHTIAPGVGWEEAVSSMHRLRVRHLPVIEDDRVIGILSSRGLMARRAEYLDQRIDSRTRELKQSNDQLLSRETELLHNLRAAGRLQNRLLLPHEPPDWPELTWAMRYSPLDHLGGDYYDIATPTPNHLGFLIADASGHSVAAAMVAIMARFAFGEVSHVTTNPGRVLAVMNQRLQELSDDRFVTAFYGVLDRRTRVFRFANAGQPYPLWYEAATGNVRPLVAQGFLLGIIPDEVYVEREITLSAGDVLCFYTDGLIEARNEIGEQYDTPRLTECMTQHAHLPCQKLLEYILADMTQFCSGVPLTDDLTVAVCQIS